MREYFNVGNAISQLKQFKKDMDSNGLTKEEIRQNKIRRLRNDMINAQNKVQNAPVEFENAQKQYYTESRGDAYYSNMQRSKFENEANRQVNLWNSQYINNLFDSISRAIPYYKSQMLYKNNVDEVYDTYNNKIKDLKKEIEKTEQVKNINHRLGEFYYNNTEIVDWWKYYLRIIYYILLVFSVVIFITKSQYKKIRMHLFFVTMFIFPFILEKYYNAIMRTFRHFKLDNIYFIFLLTIFTIIGILSFVSQFPFR